MVFKNTAPCSNTHVPMGLVLHHLIHLSINQWQSGDQEWKSSLIHLTHFGHPQCLPYRGAERESSSILKWSEVTQSCPTLCNPMDCSLPGSSLHGSLQARILEWVAITFSRWSSRLRDRTQVSCTAGRRFNLWERQ